MVRNSVFAQEPGGTHSQNGVIRTTSGGRQVDTINAREWGGRLMQGIENEGRDLGNERTGLLADTPYPHSSGNQRVPLQDRLVRQTGSDGLTISS